jgi:hypothetical protein
VLGFLWAGSAFILSSVRDLKAAPMSVALGGLDGETMRWLMKWYSCSTLPHFSAPRVVCLAAPGLVGFPQNGNEMAKQL